jgi:hypothetical protein
MAEAAMTKLLRNIPCLLLFVVYYFAVLLVVGLCWLTKLLFAMGTVVGRLIINIPMIWRKQ